MVAIQSAIQFIRNNGDKIEQARLNVLLQDHTLVQEAVEELKASQNKDGGWSPFWALEASSIDATCYRLAQCEQLGLRESSFIDNAISFIVKRQKQDGSFEEDSELTSVAPPWAMPGDVAATIYLTSNAGYWLRYYRGSDSRLTRLKEFLMSRVNDQGYLPTFLHGNWLGAGLLYSMGEFKIVESIMGYLHSKLPDLEASNLAWLINSLAVMGVSSENYLISDAGDKLQQLRSEDGRWRSEDGAWHDVHTTLEAIRALQYLSGRHSIGQ